jgi:hypothetical protein
LSKKNDGNPSNAATVKGVRPMAIETMYYRGDCAGKAGNAAKTNDRYSRQAGA